MREASDEDVYELEEMENALFPDNSMNTHTLLNELHYGKCFVEEREGKLAGYLLARVDDDVVDITRLGVRPEFRKSGVARRLMAEALGLTCRSTLLVRKGNDPAIKLYISLGYRIVGHLPEHDSWSMLRG